MRDTPKLLSAALLTISLAAAGSGAEVAVAASRTGHHGHRSAARSHARRGDAGGRRTKPARHSAAPRVRTHVTPPRPRGERPLTPAAARGHSSEAETVAATIAATLAQPCQNTEITPDAEDLPLVRAAVLCLVNRERAEHGAAPLIANADLEQAAAGHCAELISADYFAHVSPTGETPVDRIQQTGYIPGPSDGYVIGENLAWGTYSLSTPQAIVAAWIASPGHLANILESRYRETGIGVTEAVPESLGEGNPGATYAQEFGVIIH